MKFIRTWIVILLSISFSACQNQNHSQKQDQQVADTKLNTDAGTRPKEEGHFLNKVLAESDYDVTSNAIKKDEHIKLFNKYALDSLKEIKNWELIVTEINDNSADASSIVKTLGNANAAPIYNLKLVAPIKIDNSVDTIAIDNRVDFTFTTPKDPRNENLKRIVNTLKTLNKDDIVIVSGALTHINEEGKVDFAPFYDSYSPWDVDILLSDISKKVKK
jgi:hypothetical protein